MIGSYSYGLVALSVCIAILASYAALAGEMRLFVIQLKPGWSLDRMAQHHERLLTDLEREGPEPLRAHLDDGRRSIGG